MNQKIKTSDKLYNEICPMFPKTVKTIYVGFEYPSGMAVEAELSLIVPKELC
jgi:hypothetical protein